MLFKKSLLITRHLKIDICGRIVPVEGIFALGPEEVDVIFELQLENKLFVNMIPLIRSSHRVAQQRQTSKGKVILKSFVEEEAEIGEHDPELLPTVAVLKLPQKITAELILKIKTKHLGTLAQC